MGNDGRTGNQLYALQCNRIYTCTDTQLHLVQVLDIPHKKKEQHLATSAALFHSFRNGLRSTIPFPHRIGGGAGLQRIPCPVSGIIHLRKCQFPDEQTGDIPLISPHTQNPCCYQSRNRFVNPS